jgi:hypothetical protein
MEGGSIGLFSFSAFLNQERASFVFFHRSFAQETPIKLPPRKNYSSKAENNYA